MTHSAELLAALGERLAEVAERHQVPGVAVGIYWNGEEYYACHGVTSVENPLPVTEDTRFQIGSTGKTFTATALTHLASIGKVDLDATVRTYLPNFRVADEETSARVTVIQLLNHTAGWDGDFFADTGSGDDAVALFVEKMVELPQVSPLGTATSYNNAALSVAGRIIEVVTGLSYERAIKELVFAPLGLNNSGFHADDAITHRFAVGHINGVDSVTVARPWGFPRSGVPAGVNLTSSVRDQIGYARFHLGTNANAGVSVLSAEERERMQRPSSDATGESFGIGWMLQTVGDARICAHGGTTFGQLSAFEFAPEADFAITVLTNSTNGREVSDALVMWARRAFAGIHTPQPTVLPLTSEELAKYAGVYDRPEQYAEITVEGERLMMSNILTDAGRAKLAEVLGAEANWPDDDPPAEIGILENDEFALIRASIAPMGSFVRDGAGAITGLDLGGRLCARRVETGVDAV